MKFSILYLSDLNQLLSKYNITLEQFIEFSKVEKFTKHEILDLKYMEDKMHIWRELLEDKKCENILQCFKDDQIPMIARYVMRNKLSLSELSFNEEVKLGNKLPRDIDKNWLAVADHILGWVQEKTNYEEE